MFSLISGLLMLQACGQSEEERKAEQEKNEAMINEKVNEIMQKLEALPKEEVSSPVDSAASDSTAAPASAL